MQLKSLEGLNVRSFLRTYLPTSHEYASKWAHNNKWTEQQKIPRACMQDTHLDQGSKPCRIKSKTNSILMHQICAETKTRIYVVGAYVGCQGAWLSEIIIICPEERLCFVQKHKFSFPKASFGRLCKKTLARKLVMAGVCVFATSPTTTQLDDTSNLYGWNNQYVSPRTGQHWQCDGNERCILWHWAVSIRRRRRDMHVPGT